MSFTDDDLHHLTNVKIILHSLFSNFDVYQQEYNSNGLYAGKVLISNEFKASTRNNEGKLLSMHTNLKKI